MSVATWPTALPSRFLSDGFSLDFPDGRIKTQMERGPPKSRRQSSASVTPVAGQLDIDQDGVTTLRSFWDTDTKGGSLPFQMPDQISGSTVLVMFDSPPKITSLGGTWYRAVISVYMMP